MRERRLRRLIEATGENTKAGVLNVAVQHYLPDMKNKRDVVDELPVKRVEELSTPFLPLETEVTVGRE